MNILLIVSRDYPACMDAESVWASLATDRGVELKVVEIDSAEGKELTARFNLKTIPALIINNELKAIGVQTRAEAEQLLGGK